MKASQVVKWSGVAAILAGVFGIANIILGGVTGIYYAGLVATLVAVVGIYLYQRDTAGTLGLIGFVLADFGFLLSILGVSGISDLAGGLGMIILAIAALRARSFSTWIPWLWIAAVSIGITGGVLAGFQSILFPLSSTLFGIGLIAAGVVLWNPS